MDNSQHPMSTSFVVYGKTNVDDRYSVRTSTGEAVCTCAYNPDREDRQEWAKLIAAALNAYEPARARATGSTHE